MIVVPGPIDERAARLELAAAFRLAARMQLHEGVCNHFSLALPGQERFLINRFGLHWSEITASSLVVVDSAGVSDDASAIEPTAFCIHSRIHRANPHATCVLHTHMPYATALTLVSPGHLEMVHQNSLRFAGDVSYDDRYNGFVTEPAEADRIAAVLGERRVLFLANHGVIVVGPTVADAFDALYYLERACMVQVLAARLGQPWREIRGEVRDATARSIRQDGPAYAAAHFAALKRLLDRDDPGYAS